MNWWIPTILGIILLLGNIGNVLAWGVAYGDKQIAMQKGETHEIRTSLQNMIGDKEITIFISLRGDTEIAKLSQNEATLPPQTKSYPIYITITIPNNAPKDDYTVIAVYTQKETGGIMVNLAMEKTITFTIDASGKPPETSTPSNNNAGTSPSQHEPEEEIIQEQLIDNEDQDIQIPVVPNSTEQESEPIKPVSNENGWSGWWILAIIIIAGIIGFLWWDGWI